MVKSIQGAVAYVWQMEEIDGRLRKVVIAMNIIRASSADEYLESFWTRDHRPPKCGDFPEPAKRLEAILRPPPKGFPYKFPFEGKTEVSWHICQISSVSELEQLWMHKSDDWLENHNLWRGSHLLKDLARTSIDTDFFVVDRDRGSCRKNYDTWKPKGMKGQLDGHEKPMLVKHPDYIDILDGFGRLLPCLALVYEGAEFHPFEAYLANPVVKQGEDSHGNSIAP
jgi:hypothetical protein